MLFSLVLLRSLQHFRFFMLLDFECRKLYSIVRRSNTFLVEGDCP
jgi:hypothetical protein